MYSRKSKTQTSNVEVDIPEYGRPSIITLVKIAAAIIVGIIGIMIFRPLLTLRSIGRLRIRKMTPEVGIQSTGYTSPVQARISQLETKSVGEPSSTQQSPKPLATSYLEAKSFGKTLPEGSPGAASTLHSGVKSVDEPLKEEPHTPAPEAKQSFREESTEPASTLHTEAKSIDEPLKEKSPAVSRITFEPELGAKLSFRGLELSLADIVWFPFHKSQFKKFFGDSWDSGVEHDPARISINLKRFIEKAMKVADRKLESVVKLIDGPNEYKCPANDAIDLYVCMKKQPKTDLYLILREDGLFVTGKLAKDKSYYLVPLGDVITRKMGEKEFGHLSQSIDKLAYEMLKEYDWMSFYDGWSTAGKFSTYRGDTDMDAFYRDSLRRDAIGINLTRLNLFAGDRYYIKPKHNTMILYAYQSKTINADTVLDIYVQVNKMTMLQEQHKAIYGSRIDFWMDPTRKYIVLNLNRKVMMGSLDPRGKYMITTWEVDKFDRLRSPLDSYEEIFLKIEELGRQMVHLPHKIEVANWLYDRFKSFFPKWKPEERVSGTIFSFDTKPARLGFRCLNERTRALPPPIQPVSPLPKQQVSVSFKGKPLDKMDAEFAIDIYLQIPEIVKENPKYDSAVVVDSNDLIVTDALQKGGEYRIITFEKALKKNHFSDMYADAHYLAYWLFLRYSKTPPS